MAKEMLINVSAGEECRIALLDSGKLAELYTERTSSTSHVGNIYKGRVTNIEASIQAAFIDFGMGRNGFLHISDLLPQYFGHRGEDVQEAVGRKIARRDRPPIQRCLRRGDEVIVQIIKEGIGTKGPTLTTYLSIPGRILVMMPGMTKMGVSRKIEDETERRRLRQILDSLHPPQDVGFIIRTAGVGKTKVDIERDFKYLTRLWEQMAKVKEATPAPVELYTEGDLVTRTVRDVFNADIERIVVDNKDVAQRIKEFIKITAPRTRNKVELYDQPIPLFHKYGIEREIEQINSRHVPLPSGGSLVIDSTEAVVAIDVNSGKFREHADAETTAFRTDMEAADEICRQLRLRDLGGVIICDFIDLRFERHRRELERRIADNFSRDRAKTRVLRMSQFGIIEITRQRMRPSLKRSIYYDCPHCRGAGLVKTPESMSLDVMRKLAIAINDQRVTRVEISVNVDVAFYLQNRKRAALATLESQTRKRVVIRIDTHLALDEARFDLYDQREGLVVISTLEVQNSDQVIVGRLQNQAPNGSAQRDGRRGRGGRDGRDNRDERGRRHQLPKPAETELSGEDLFDDDLDESRDADDRIAAQADNGPDQQEQSADFPSAADQSSEQAHRHDERDGNGRDGNGSRSGRRRRGGRGRRRGGQSQTPVSGQSSHWQAQDQEQSHDLAEEQGVQSDRGDQPTESSEVYDEDGIGPAPQVMDNQSTSWSDDRDEVRNNHASATRQEIAWAVDEAAGNDEINQAKSQTAESTGDQSAQEDDGNLYRAANEADEAGEKNGAEAANGGNQTETPKKRRRGRRGGRGRHKKTDSASPSSSSARADEVDRAAGSAAREPARPASAADSSQTPAKPAAASPVATPTPAPLVRKSTPVKRIVSRGLAAKQRVAPRAGRSGKNTGNSPASSSSSPTSTPTPVVTPIVPTVEAPRTGSADRHLADDDEPFATRPARRPSSVRDLDAIPDEYD